MEGHSAFIHLNNHAKPPKACTVCGSPIQWRRWRAVDWDKMKYCSASCRRVAVATVRTLHEGRVEGHGHLAVTALLATRDKVA
jgi:hypothetical protein